MAAGDWLKWPKGFSTWREIFVISSTLNLNRQLVAAACFELLEWVDANAPSGFAHHTSISDIDLVVDIPRFGEALQKVGWIRDRASGIEITRFTERSPIRERVRPDAKAVNSRGQAEYVYFILAPISRSIKVGASASPVARLDGLQTGNPDQLELLGYFRGGRRAERRIHIEYDRFIVQGEWLGVCDDVRQLVLDRLGSDAHEKLLRVETHWRFLQTKDAN